jgi:hypothetical protein
VPSNRQEAAAAAKRLGVTFVFLVFAFLGGSVTHSVAVFVGMAALAVALGIGLRLKRAFG